MSSAHIEASSHIDFISVFDRLLEKLFLEDKITESSLIEVPSHEIRRATWLASIAALGN